MLRPAQLYEDKLQKANIESWYDLKNQYWNGWCSENKIKIHDNNGEYHQFVSVDKDDNVIGYICYYVNWVIKSVTNIGIISFDKGNMTFITDVKAAVLGCFTKYNLNRLEFRAYADNPAIRCYRRYIKKYGGRECGYFRNDTMLMDGKLHDTVFFEIIREDLKEAH